MARRRPGPFAGPGKSFPIGDKKHARLAIGGATHSFHAGNISESTEEVIKGRARSALKSFGARRRTGKTKVRVGP